jgi:hypothetical protein
VEATATVTDTLGLSGTTPVQVSSHGLSGASRLGELAAGLALPPLVAPADRAAAAARLEVMDNVPSGDPDDPAGRKARIVYAAALERSVTASSRSRS